MGSVRRYGCSRIDLRFYTFLSISGSDVEGWRLRHLTGPRAWVRYLDTLRSPHMKMKCRLVHVDSSTSRWGTTRLVFSQVNKRDLESSSLALQHHQYYRQSPQLQIRHHGARAEDVPEGHGQEDRQGPFELQRQQKCRRHGTLETSPNRRVARVLTRLTSCTTDRYSSTTSYSCKRAIIPHTECSQLPGS